MSGKQAYDIVIVGAGLSGLAAGVRLIQKGKSVLLLEKTGVPGGCAKRALINDSWVEVGSNQVGKSIIDDMQSLGIKQKFIPVKNRFVFADDSILELPCGPVVLDGFFEPVKLMALIAGQEKDKSLREATNDIKDLVLRNKVRALFTYFLLQASDKISLKLAYDFFINDYGNDTPMVPEGGMSRLVDRLVEKFTELGGEIRCNANYLKAKQLGDKKSVFIQEDGLTSSCHTDLIVSSVHGWERYPEATEQSLVLGACIFEMKPNFQYPDGVHTIIFIPEDIDAWLNQHECGELSNKPGFHCFINQQAANDSGQVCRISAYMMWQVFNFSTPNTDNFFVINGLCLMVAIPYVLLINYKSQYIKRLKII